MQTVDFRALAHRFPNMTYRDLCDFLFMLGIEMTFELVEIDPFLKDAWKRKAEHELGGEQ